MKEHDAASTTRTAFERVAPALVEAARALPTATLHEAGGKAGACRVPSSRWPRPSG